MFSEVVTQRWRLRQSLVWVKSRLLLGHTDYHYQHEAVMYAYKPAAGRWGRVGGRGWFGDHAQVSVFHVDTPNASREHPTMKPVELIVPMVRNSSPKGGAVLDPFGGSGSTLIACERTGRRARLVEVDPAYVDVICRRWQDYTGRLPVLEATGEPCDFGDDRTAA
ncbi:MAG: site-specific DNA-methyltransferase [Acidimicrobiales bacterium]|nr:site-specific DNA-methyltransferase [Acidimicrobiales bacterium]